MEGNAAASYCALLALVVLMGIAGVVMQLAEERRRRGESAKDRALKSDSKEVANDCDDVENEQ